mmetsp:Transcript_9527/g.20684  ORF Transcript_9527/g.20684 Transcript_9527/m.20684 type:complete len:211 (+) Transcript_9527:25-657(+)
MIMRRCRSGPSSAVGFPWSPSLLLLFLFCPNHDRPFTSAFLLPPPRPQSSSTTTTRGIERRRSSVRIPQRDPRQRLNYHPAVEGWERKYLDGGGGDKSSRSDGGTTGPRALSSEFEVRAATEAELSDLDVEHWPVWTTSDKEKWGVGNSVPNKEMPYGELSYVISGKLEIVPRSTGVPSIVSEGDLVTFPKGFVASWKVLEELTWNYYLY